MDPFTACLLFSLVVMKFVKIGVVDRQYAQQGKPLPSYDLAARYLDTRSARGKGDPAERPAPYGAKAYFRQRWLALWEDLGRKHAEQRAEQRAERESPAGARHAEEGKGKSSFLKTAWQWAITPIGEARPSSAGRPLPPRSSSEDHATGADRDQPAVAVPRRPSVPADDTDVPAAETFQVPAPFDPVSSGGYLPAGSRCPACGGAGGSKSRRGRYVFVHDSNGAAECPTGNDDVVPDFLLDERERRDRARRNGVPVTVCGRCGRNRELFTEISCQDCADICLQCGGPADQGTTNANARGGVCDVCAARNFVLTDRSAGGRGGSTDPDLGDIGMDCRWCGEFLGRFTSHDEANDWFYANHRCPANNGEILPRNPDEKFGFTCHKCGHRSEQIYPSMDAARAAYDNTHQCPTDEGEPMVTSPAPQQSGEVTGIRSAVAYGRAMADAHTQHGSNEGFLSALQRLDVGEGDQAKFGAAMEASRNAAAAWAEATQSLEDNNAAVAEAYRSAPDAGSKEAQLTE